ncbi:EI2BA factor, partial [Stercorarius parasiticus]|nr:EI2BA factor [Stercorarius parasiticus]
APRCFADLIETFRAQLRDDPDVASAVAAIRALLGFLKQDRGETIQGLRSSLLAAIDTLSRVDSSVAVSSGGELFLRFISLTSLEYSVRAAAPGPDVLPAVGGPSCLTADIALFFRITPISNIFFNRQKMAKALRKLNIPVTVILDAAVGYIMEKVDLVLVGAEGVVESGGIINKIGTNQIAVCAKAQNKPFYVVAESFKFVRLFPLNQQDVPDKFKYKADTLKTSQNLTEEHPWIDYTSPSLITLLFTDLGVLTPSAVSDELIKLYL